MVFKIHSILLLHTLWNILTEFTVYGDILQVISNNRLKREAQLNVCQQKFGSNTERWYYDETYAKCCPCIKCTQIMQTFNQEPLCRFGDFTADGMLCHGSSCRDPDQPIPRITIIPPKVVSDPVTISKGGVSPINVNSSQSNNTTISIGRSKGAPSVDDSLHFVAVVTVVLAVILVILLFCLLYWCICAKGLSKLKQQLRKCFHKKKPRLEADGAPEVPNSDNKNEVEESPGDTENSPLTKADHEEDSIKTDILSSVGHADTPECKTIPTESHQLHAVPTRPSHRTEDPSFSNTRSTNSSGNLITMNGGTLLHNNTINGNVYICDPAQHVPHHHPPPPIPSVSTHPSSPEPQSFPSSVYNDPSCSSSRPDRRENNEPENVVESHPTHIMRNDYLSTLLKQGSTAHSCTFPKEMITSHRHNSPRGSTYRRGHREPTENASIVPESEENLEATRVKTFAGEIHDERQYVTHHSGQHDHDVSDASRYHTNVTSRYRTPVQESTSDTSPRSSFSAQVCHPPHDFSNTNDYDS